MKLEYKVLGGDKQCYKSAAEIVVKHNRKEIAAVRIEIKDNGEIVAYLYPVTDDYFGQEPERFILKEE